MPAQVCFVAGFQHRLETSYVGAFKASLPKISAHQEPDAHFLFRLYLQRSNSICLLAHGQAERIAERGRLRTAQKPSYAVAVGGMMHQAGWTKPRASKKPLHELVQHRLVVICQREFHQLIRCDHF